IGFAGMAGAMLLNQLVKDSEPGELEPVLRAAVAPPNDLDEAGGKINALAAYIRELRHRGSGAAVARSPFFLSWFWWVLVPDRWQPIWISAEKALIGMAWLPDHRKGDGAEDQG